MEHPQLSQYFRMLKVGVPYQAVKAKMQREGADSFYLDKPNYIIRVDEFRANNNTNRYEDTSSGQEDD